MKRLFFHTGLRANRAEFVFWGAILNTISAILFVGQMEMFRELSTGPSPEKGLLAIGFGLIGVVVGLVGLWCSLTLYARRFHDLNLSGWWYFAVVFVLIIMFFLLPDILVSALGTGFFLFMALKPGTRGENRFGPEPTGTEGFYPRAVNRMPVFVIFLIFAICVPIAQSVYARKVAERQAQLTEQQVQVLQKYQKAQSQRVQSQRAGE